MPKVLSKSISLMLVLCLMAQSVCAIPIDSTFRPVQNPQLSAQPITLFQEEALVSMAIGATQYIFQTARKKNVVVQHQAGNFLLKKSSLIGWVGALWYVVGSHTVLQGTPLSDIAVSPTQLTEWAIFCAVITAILWTFRQADGVFIRSIAAQMLALNIFLTFAYPPWFMYLIQFHWTYWWPYGLVSALVALSTFPIHYLGDRLFGQLAGAKVGSLGPRGLKKHTLGQRIAYLSGGPILNLAVAALAHLFLVYIIGPVTDGFSVSGLINEIFALHFMTGIGALMPISPRAGGGLILRLVIEWLRQPRDNHPRGRIGFRSKRAKTTSENSRSNGSSVRHSQRLILQAV